MSLATNLSDAFTRVATESKALRTLLNGNTADLTALNTTAKNNLVAAINEVYSGLGAAGATVLDELTDVTITAAATGQIIRFDGAQWVNADGTAYFQPLDADLTAIAGTATTAYGRGLLALADQAALMALLALASEAAPGIVELATTAEATTGTDTSRAVTPAGMAAAISAANNALIDAAPGTLDTLNELAAALGDDPNFATTMTNALAMRVRVDAVQAFTGPQQTQGRSNIDAASATDVGDTTTNFVTVFEAGLV
jgi:hypothetical protein